MGDQYNLTHRDLLKKAIDDDDTDTVFRVCNENPYAWRTEHAIQCAKKDRSVILEYIYNRMPPEDLERDGNLILIHAIKNGHWDTYRWAKDRGCVWVGRPSTQVFSIQGRNMDIVKEEWVDGVITGHAFWTSLASANNNLDALKWLVDEKGEPMDDDVCRHAALLGNDEMLEWARANDAPYDADLIAEIDDEAKQAFTEFQNDVQTHYLMTY